ncbi:unnamed protein product, partial [Sphenostylis stenocarpa]
MHSATELIVDHEAGFYKFFSSIQFIKLMILIMYKHDAAVELPTSRISACVTYWLVFLSSALHYVHGPKVGAHIWARHASDHCSMSTKYQNLYPLGGEM